MLEYKGYLGRAEFDDEANIFHGQVINIQDVITFQGKSVDELQQAFKDSVEDYLGFCAERGEEPEQPFALRFLSLLHREPTDYVTISRQLYEGQTVDDIFERAKENWPLDSGGAGSE
jgi:predicted HicB family RNase H-like nuclease